MLKIGPHHRHLLLRALCVAGLFLLLLVKTGSVYAQVAQTSQRTILSRAKPEYPALAIRMHISGCVRVLVSVEPDGSVSRVEAISGHAFLRKPAEQAVRQWRFGRASTPSEMTVEVHFDLQTS